MEYIVYQNHKKLRCGFTTGTCAAGATKAALQILLGEEAPKEVQIGTPKGISLSLPVLHPQKGQGWACAAIQKDSGDDPDATNGILVYAKVQWQESSGVVIEGGEGIGRVTKPGLECPVGCAAINHVPREMITAEVEHLLGKADSASRGVLVLLSIPGGAELAAKTYNPRLGIMGGLSVLGTSGIVEPMSEKALVDSIRVELKMRLAAGERHLILTPGNYGEAFLKEQQISLRSRPVQCSNFVGEALDSAAEFGFESLLLVGHIGKLVKLGGGVMNTHSRYADCRMELLTAHAALAGGGQVLAEKLMDCVSTDQALALLEEAGIREEVLASLLKKIDFYLQNRAGETLRTAAIIFSNQYGFLGQTAGTQALLEEWRNH